MSSCILQAIEERYYPVAFIVRIYDGGWCISAFVWAACTFEESGLMVNDVYSRLAVHAATQTPYFREGFKCYMETTPNFILYTFTVV